MGPIERIVSNLALFCMIARPTPFYLELTHSYSSSFNFPGGNDRFYNIFLYRPENILRHSLGRGLKTFMRRGEGEIKKDLHGREGRFWVKDGAFYLETEKI